jgi:hypothetical protein
MDESRNIAYTSLFLGVHMDLQCVLHQRLHFNNNDNSFRNLQVHRVPATILDLALPA